MDQGDPTQQRSSFTRLIAQLLIVAAVIAVLSGLLLSLYAKTKQKALDAKKQLELGGIHTTLVQYYIDENQAPQNHSNESHCVIGKLYNNKKCLRELSRDGYGAPPTSPNDEPYYYYDDDEKFYVATKLSRELPKDKKCPYEKDSHVWCKFYIK